MAQESTFNRLPFELRLRIYDYFLLADGPITLADSHPRFEGHMETQLLRTCRQIHDEAANVLYGSNRFETLLHQNGLPARHLNKWLRKITDSNVARLNRLKFLVLYPAPTRKGVSGLFHVETNFRLRKTPSWDYSARFVAFGSTPYSNDVPLQPINIQLAPDLKVDEQLEMRFRTKKISGAPWSLQDINFIYAAISDIRPQPRKDVDVSRLPESVMAFFHNEMRWAR